ncbi:methionyl-tRNA synthetase [Coemansia sp. RSA 1935]|nr:methionyl-tRNA synthetase [Coemansia sp. RSA 1935]
MFGACLLNRPAVRAGRMCRRQLLAKAQGIGKAQFSTSIHPKSKFYVTQPIFYVNSEPHIGHFYTMVLSDTIKRFADLCGKTTKLSSGTDEHGQKIQQAADLANEPPLDFCTRYSDKFRSLAVAANTSATDFIRTTSDDHHTAVRKFWQRLVDGGFIYKGEHSGWYAVSDEAYYTSTQVEERVNDKGESGMYAIESGKRVEWVSEVNYKFRMSVFGERLLKWIEENPSVIYPAVRRNEVLGWLRMGLEDLSVSRPRNRQQWGISVPGDPDHTIYVWVDALINYLTVDGFAQSDVLPFFPPDVQVVGKDIVRFHAVYWPALLMAANLPLPRRILAHAHWTMGAQKMSKSIGNVADPFVDIERFGVDALRYFIVRNGGIADDGDYSNDEVIVRYKKDLVGQLANLAARCLSERLGADLNVFARIGREQLDHAEPGDIALRDMLVALPDRVHVLFEQGEFGRGLALVFDALAVANKHVTENEPWLMVKQAPVPERLQVVLFYSLEAVRLASIMLMPVMPIKAAHLLDHLDITDNERMWTDARFGAGWQPLDRLRQSKPGVAQLFPKLE